MPRQPRQFVPGVPLHIVQRGNDKRSCFHHRGDYSSYLEAVRDSALQFQLEVHAYVLMTNHIHLLVTPQDCEGPSRMMQQIGRKYVLHFNRKHSRVGALWEGRFKSSSIKSARYLLACYRYIELNPVRAGLVATPDAYVWSSHRSNAYGQASEIVTPHSQWIGLGDTGQDRLEAYRRLFLTDASVDDDERIRTAWRKNLPIEKGSDPFGV